MSVIFFQKGIPSWGMEQTALIESQGSISVLSPGFLSNAGSFGNKQNVHIIFVTLARGVRIFTNFSHFSPERKETGSFNRYHRKWSLNRQSQCKCKKKLSSTLSQNLARHTILQHFCKTSTSQHCSVQNQGVKAFVMGISGVCSFSWHFAKF